MVKKVISKETMERAVSLKILVEKYYEQLDKQVFDRSQR